MILKTAYNMFLFRNYEAVTINSIIKNTGLTKGAIYHYYDSKEALFKAVVEEYMLETRKDFFCEFSSLKEFIQHLVNLVKEKMSKLVGDNTDTNSGVPINYLSLMVSAYRYYPDFAKIGKEFFNNQNLRWEMVIKKAIENNEIKEDIDVEATIANFMSASSWIITNIMSKGSLTYGLEMFESQCRQLYNSLKK
ncbi:MAG TPA: TetR/AcrR family transcriptional regulator [Bacteroidales bacterium]|nr:TetR/AcrR family transcriptional regulator [Bacteroidales bacterium]HPS73725.1 TetR/AcrR family transcriptional regulator [Bacteroidales bacterium]